MARTTARSWAARRREGGSSAVACRAGRSAWRSAPPDVAITGHGVRTVPLSAGHKVSDAWAVRLWLPGPAPRRVDSDDTPPRRQLGRQVRTMQISFAGKGGSGKTTISATVARTFARRGHAVRAIDGDSNPNLALALGIPAPEAIEL